MRSECSYHALLRNPRPRALCRLPLIVKLGSTHDRKGDDRKPSPGPDTSAEGSRFGARQPQSTRGSEARMAPYSEHSSTSKNGCPKNSPASRLTPLSQHETPCHSSTKCGTFHFSGISDSDDWRLSRCPPHDAYPLAPPDCRQPPEAVYKIQPDPDVPPRNFRTAPRAAPWVASSAAK